MNINSNVLTDIPKQQGTTRPVASTQVLNNNTLVNVPVIISEDDGIYTWVYITMNEYNYHYRGLVDIIVSLKYDLTETLAILFNYMDEPENEVYKKEYNDFQSWRKFAKEYSKNHFKTKN